MKLTYDPEANAVYLVLKGHGVDHTVRVGSDVAIDYGPDGEIHGIEILAASEHLGFKKRPKIMLKNLTVVKR